MRHAGSPEVLQSPGNLTCWRSRALPGMGQGRVRRGTCSEQDAKPPAFRKKTKNFKTHSPLSLLLSPGGSTSARKAPAPRPPAALRRRTAGRPPAAPQRLEASAAPPSSGPTPRPTKSQHARCKFGGNRPPRILPGC